MCALCKEVQVIFVENHWQMEDVMKLYLHYLKLHFRDYKNISLILDGAKMHGLKSLIEHTDKTNIFPPTIYLAFLPKNLTAVFSLLNQVTIKNLKREIRIRNEIEMHGRDY